MKGGGVGDSSDTNDLCGPVHCGLTLPALWVRPKSQSELSPPFVTPGEKLSGFFGPNQSHVKVQQTSIESGILKKEARKGTSVHIGEIAQILLANETLYQLSYDPIPPMVGQE